MPQSNTGSGARAAQPKKKTPKVKRPSPTKIAHAQEQQYASQGKAVEKVANTQKKTAVRKQQLARSKPAAGDAPQTRAKDTQRAQAYVKKQYVKKAASDKANRIVQSPRIRAPYKAGTTVPPDVASRVKERGSVLTHQANVAGRVAPVLKVLDQTTRPVHAVAGAADAAVTGKNVLKAAQRGIQNKDRTTFSDVLKHAGVKNKTVRGIAGFALDVGLDPTTYVTGGTASVARNAATKAGEKATAKAVKAGLTKDQAARFGERAASQAEKTAPKTKTVTVKVAGKEIPGVAKATAAASKPVRAAGRGVTPERVRRGARGVAADVNPNITPVGVEKAVSDKAIAATRRARSEANQGTRAAVDVAHGIRKQIGEKNYNAVVDAIEAGNLKTLTPELARHAHTLRSELKGIRRQQRRAGVKVPERKGYVPRQLTATAKEAEGKATTGSVSQRVIKPKSSKARTETRPMSELRAKKPGRYREDLHALVAERLAEGATSAAKAGLNRTLADIGRTIKRGEDLKLGDGESVYHVKGSDITKLSDEEAQKVTRPLRLSKDGTKVKGANKQGGRFVVLNDDVVKRATEGSAATLQGPGVVKGYDKVTGGFKRIALATPGFHIRNAVGDTFQAYVKQPGHKLAGNIVRARKITNALGDQEKAARKLEQPKPSGKTLKTKKYGHVSYEDIAKNLVGAGAARSGYTARELKELSTSGGVKDSKILKPGKALGATKVGTGSKRALLNREDIPRLATAIHALQQGASWEEAASHVASTHFDYGHLTNFERNIARRIMPFYTWTARNVPFTAKNVVARPGKYANFQKVREEAEKASQPGQVDQQTRDLYKQLEAAGVKLPGGYAKYLGEWEQRNAGIPISWKGHKFTASMGLPLQDLNEFPGAAGKGQAGEYMNKAASLVSPIIKDPVELAFNYSFFFRDQIERDTSPKVAAPAYVAKFPDAAKRKLGIVQGKDKRSGKTVWMWPGKVDYVAHSVPGLPNTAQQLATPGHDRRGKGVGSKLLGVAGVKSVPVDPTTNAVNLAYARQQEIQKRLSGLRQSVNPANGEPISAKNPTQEYTKLNAQLKITTQIAYQGKVQRGDKVLPPQGGPPKVRSSPRVQLPGLTTARVKLPSVSSGRVKLP